MGIFDALDISGSALSAERLRMDVTSENLANAQTTRGANGQPYQRKDVDFESSLRAAMASGQNPDSLQFSVQTDASAPMQPDGNSVDIDTESSKLAENGLDYESLITVAKGRLDILQSAIGGGA